MTDTHTSVPGQAGTDLPRSRRPLGVEIFSFFGLTAFFIPVVVLFGFWSSWEPVGTTGLALLAAMWAMVVFILVLQSRKVDDRPEDDPAGRVEDHPVSNFGHFPPFSWWPFVLGLAVTIAFTGLAVGWWLFGIGAAMAAIGIVGW